MRQDFHNLLQKVKQGQLSQFEAYETIQGWMRRAAPAQVNNPLSPDRPVLTRTYTHGESFLRDHRGENPFDPTPGSQVLLGVTHLSLAVEAGRLLYNIDKGFRVKKLAITGPVVVYPGEMAELGLSVREKENRFLFSTACRKTGEAAPRETASGEIVQDLLPDPPRVKLDRFIEQSDVVIPGAEVYGKAEAERGESLATVQRLYLLGGETVAELSLAPGAAKTTYVYHCHPALLDGAFVGSFPGRPPHNRPYGLWIPFIIGEALVYGPLPHRCYCHIQSTLTAPGLMTANFVFSDRGGEVFLVLKEFSYRLVRLDNSPGSQEEAMPVKTSFMSVSRPTSDKTGGLQHTVEHYLTTKISTVLGQTLQPAERKKTFMDLGIDSNHLVILTRGLEKELGLELYPTLFFEYQTIAELAAYFSREHETALAGLSELAELAELAGLPGGATSPGGTADTESSPRYETIAPAAGVTSSLSTFVAAGVNEQDIAVIGMAGRFAGSPNLVAFWENLKAGQDLVTEIPPDHWDWRPYFAADRNAPDKSYSKWGSFIEIDKFDSLFFDISPREAIWLDPQLRLLLEVTQEAIDDAGYAASLAGSRTGVYVGSCFREYWDEIVHMHIPIVDYQASSCIWSLLSGRISYTFDLQGPSIPLDNACASSLTAVYLACRSLQNRECDLALAAGVNLLISPLHYIYSSRLQALSPTGRCRTFDKNADGYVPGEGVGVLLLKPLSRAVQDNDNIHAVIKGIGANHVGRSNNPTAPRPELQTRLLADTWTGSGIDPASLSYIEAHGTGTILGDPIEFSALEKAFGMFTGRKSFCAIGSAKAHLGHLEAAAGIAGMIKTILSMKHKQIPMMPTFNQLNPYIDLENSPFFINRQLQEWTTPPGIPRRAGVNSFGITGNNVHVVLEEYIAKPVDSGGDILNTSSTTFIFILSAKEQERLEEYTRRLAAFLEQEPLPYNLEDIVYTLQVGREAMTERLALVVCDQEDLKNKLHRCCRGETAIPHTYRGRAGGGDAETAETIDFSRDIDPDHLAQQWVAGAAVDWRQLYPNPVPRRVSLPTYPFAREQYWLPRQAPGGNPPPVNIDENNRDTGNELLEILKRVKSGELDSSEADRILENLFES